MGAHGSGAAPLLQAPTLAVAPSASSLLCFGCHNIDTYIDPAGTGLVANTSWFYNGVLAMPSLHKRHSAATVAGGLGFACAACHVTHGSATLPHLLRSDIGYLELTPPPDRGQCSNACHGGPPARSYPGP